MQKMVIGKVHRLKRNIALYPPIRVRKFCVWRRLLERKECIAVCAYDRRHLLDTVHYEVNRVAVMPCRADNAPLLAKAQFAFLEACLVYKDRSTSLLGEKKGA